MIASTWAVQLNWAFDVLTDLFDHVGLWADICKTVSMVFQLCHSMGGMLVKAHAL